MEVLQHLSSQPLLAASLQTVPRGRSAQTALPLTYRCQAASQLQVARPESAAAPPILPHRAPALPAQQLPLGPGMHMGRIQHAAAQHTMYPPGVDLPRGADVIARLVVYLHPTVRDHVQLHGADAGMLETTL